MAGIGIDKIVGRVLKMDGDANDPDRFMCVSVLIDESVSPALVEHARGTLRPTTGNVRMTIDSYYDEAISVAEGEDLAIVLANNSLWTGAVASIAKAKGVPCVIVAEQLKPVIAHAEATGFLIDYENIISPEVLFTGLGSLSLPAPVAQIADRGLGVAETAANLALRDVPEKLFGRVFSIDRINLTGGGAAARKEEVYDKLFDELGGWVMRNCDEVAAPFAKAFEFSRSAQAGQVTRRTAFENAVTGAIFFIPGADFPIMTFNEVRMLIRIERAYGHEVDKQMLIEAAMVICFGFACKLVASGMCKAFPALSWFIKTGIAYCATFAMGVAMQGHCENGRVLPHVVVAQLQRFAPKLLPEHLQG
ncbi:MAG: hypothetical protein ACOYIP_07890 [Coriobacteriales bacterium]|jgi:uncharacterized protein (DUF697 family)